MSKGRPRKNGERTACGALKRVADNGLTPTAIKRISEDLARGAGDKRFETEVARLLFERKINDREAAAAFRVAEVYGKFERLHGKRRSAVSPSYAIGRSGSPELSDDRMTDEQIAVRDKLERDIEAAFMALQDAIPSYPAHCRSLLESLCIENRHIPEIWLPEVRWMLERIAKAARIPGQKDRKAGKTVPRDTVSRTNGTGNGHLRTDSPSIVPRQPFGNRSPFDQRSGDDRDAWFTVARKLRPDLDDASLLQAYRLQGALKDRAVLMRERATSA